MPFEKGIVHTHRSPGRPKGFRGVAKRIARETKDGKELVEYALKVFRKDRHARNRWQAMEWLADRGFGKATQLLTIDADLDVQHHNSKLDLARLTPEQRSQLREMLASMRVDQPQQIEEVRIAPGSTLLRVVDDLEEDE